MIAVVDYGSGNLRSMAKALEYVGAEVVVTSSPGDLDAADRIVLPGVGAFGEAARQLRASKLVDSLEEEVLGKRKPFLGVCVGMQLLARESLEHGRHQGLGWLDATVVPLESDDPSIRIPHTGWNDLELVHGDSSPVSGLQPAESVYFNHGYHLEPDDETIVVARAHHGIDFVAAVARDNIVATQFHPEKSQQAGLSFLAEFAVWQPLVPAA